MLKYIYSVLSKSFWDAIHRSAPRKHWALETDITEKNGLVLAFFRSKIKCEANVLIVAFTVLVIDEYIDEKFIIKTKRY